MYNQFLVASVISMILWQTPYAFVIKDQQFTIDVANSTQPDFNNVSIAASLAIVIDSEGLPSIPPDVNEKNETSTDETDQKKPSIKQVSVSFVQIEKTVEISPDNNVKSTVENEKEEKESLDSPDDSDEEQDKLSSDKYSPSDDDDEDDVDDSEDDD